MPQPGAAGGAGWPLPEGLDDAQLEALLYPPPPDGGVGAAAGAGLGGGAPRAAAAEHDAGAAVGRIPRRAGGQDGFGYSWFCDLYREWAGRLKPTLRQVHTAGERVFVDFAGHTMEVIDGADRRGAPRRGLRRRARRLQLHLCRGDLDAVAARLDCRPRQHAGAHSAACRGRSSATTCVPGSPGPASTSRWSTAPTPTWRRTTAPR